MVDKERLLETIDDVVTFIVALDMPQLSDADRLRLIGHLTGAVFVRVAQLMDES